MTSVITGSGPSSQPQGSGPPRIHFTSGSTGSILGEDYGMRSSDWDFTTDPLRNHVDLMSRSPWSDSHAYVIFGVDNPAAPKLLEITRLDYSYIFLYLGTREPQASSDSAQHATAPARRAETPPEEAPQLSVILNEVYELCGLSAGDAARMIGLRRRQFYNLLRGFGTKESTEARIRLIAAHVDEIAERLGRDSELVRGAILTPLGPESTSYFEAAEAGDAEAMREKLASLLQRIETRGIRRVRRAVPRKATARAREARRELAMEALAGQSEGPHPASEERPDGNIR